jgi:hypothetical protein
MSVEGKKRGSYSRRVTEDPKNHVRDRVLESEAEERSTGRKVRAAVCGFWQARNIAEVPRAGGWFWAEEDAPRKWVSRKPPPAERMLPPPKPETHYQQIVREAKERQEAAEMEKFWQEEWDRDMAEIERERRTKERRAAGLIRRRHNKRDAPQATPDPSTGQPEGTPRGR